MSNKDKSPVVATRWWWVRHAPVRSDGGNIYGQKDIACDTSDSEVFEAVAAPVASLGTRGAWLAGRRLLAIDGFDLDLPDTPENAAEFGYGDSAQGRSAFPKAHPGRTS